MNSPKLADHFETRCVDELIPDVKRSVRNSSRLQDLILDPLATMIVCQRTGRETPRIELEPQCVDVTVQRWQNFTGEKAGRDADGRTFAETERERLAPTAEPPQNDGVSDQRSL